MFEGVENASSNSKLPYLSPGQYVLQVDGIKQVSGRGGKGPFFIAEFTVLDAKGNGANEVGSRASHVTNMALESALGNVKGFVSALIAKPEKAVTKQICDELLTEAQPARGSKVKADAFMTKTRAMKDFTKITYSPVAGEAKAKKAA